LNRETYDIQEHQLPFCGVDVWHAYEPGFLTQKGLPVTGILKITYPADSPFLVESKSLKLYLNSFNMQKIGKNVEEGISQLVTTGKTDLENLLQAPVQVKYFGQQSDDRNIADFNDYEILEKIPEIEKLGFIHYQETPSLLQKEQNTEKTEIKVATQLLRSNCKVTFQPDWGSAFIYLKGITIPDKANLLKYLVSIRNENHFHEEICEMIYKRLWDTFSPEKLMVACIYTRRGGIDISPVRANETKIIPQNIINMDKLTTKLLRQ
jgi:7-cyano-7-deazaguanine reductase